MLTKRARAHTHTHTHTHTHLCTHTTIHLHSWTAIVYKAVLIRIVFRSHSLLQWVLSRHKGTWIEIVPGIICGTRCCFPVAWCGCKETIKYLILRKSFGKAKDELLCVVQYSESVTWQNVTKVLGEPDVFTVVVQGLLESEAGDSRLH